MSCGDYMKNLDDFGDLVAMAEWQLRELGCTAVRHEALAGSSGIQLLAGTWPSGLLDSDSREWIVVVAVATPMQLTLTRSWELFVRNLTGDGGYLYLYVAPGSLPCAIDLLDALQVSRVNGTVWIVGEPAPIAR